MLCRAPRRRRTACRCLPPRPRPASFRPPPSPVSPRSAARRTVSSECSAITKSPAASGDCPLPELFRRLNDSHRDLSIGVFHDGLRQLHEQHRVYLHPWTGPLYELPEPPFALLIGHEIAYYASARANAD